MSYDTSSLSEKHMIPTDVRQKFEDSGLDVDEDGLVSWQQDSPKYPRNWNIQKKVFDSGLVIVFEFIATLFSNTGVAAAEHSSSELGVSREVAIFAFSTTYLLGQAIGSVVLPPYTETFGRRPSYVAACVVYTIFCIIVAAPDHIAAVIVGRFVSGFVSAVPSTVAAGSLEELWGFKGRIWAYNFWVSSAILGLAIGPVVSTFLSTSSLGWRWIFWIATIVTGALAVLAVFMAESRPNAIIESKIASISKAYREESFPKLHCKTEDQVPSFTSFLANNLARPVKLLFTESIVLTVTVLSSTVYATIYLLTEAFQVVYADFGFSERQGSLVNLTLIIGLVLSLFIRVMDNHIAATHIAKKKPLNPEDKLMGFYIAAPCLAIATWWFAWTVPPAASPASTSPFASMPALILVGFACNEFDYVLSGYLTDSYTTYASSANASLGFFRAALSGCYPLFGTQMFENLGNNVAGSALAAVATGYCFVAVLFWKYGERIRRASQVAD